VAARPQQQVAPGGRPSPLLVRRRLHDLNARDVGVTETNYGYNGLELCQVEKKRGTVDFAFAEGVRVANCCALP
jgi:hypothetical protein